VRQIDLGGRCGFAQRGQDYGRKMLVWREDQDSTVLFGSGRMCRSNSVHSFKDDKTL